MADSATQTSEVTGITAARFNSRAPVPATGPAFGRRNLVVAAVLFGVALLTLLAFERLFGVPTHGVSAAPQFVYQAQSFLQGRWDLDLAPPVTDIIVLHGKNYIVYPPFPALVLVPFVALFGLHASDILLTTVCSALNLPLLFLLFEQVRVAGYTRRNWLDHVTISLVLYFGSISLWLSLGGRMWFTAHILCMTCMLASLLLAFRRHYGWSAVLLACAFFCRATALFGFPFLYYLAWQDAGAQPVLAQFVASVRARAPQWQTVPWRRLLPPLAVTALMLVLFMARNVAIFGTPFETGYDILIRQRYPTVTQGPFNLAYVPANIVANFFSFPQVTFTGPFDRHPVLEMMNGGYCVSAFVTTPLFLLLFWRNRRVDLTRAMLWLTLGVVVVAVLLFHAAGWRQFGARYLFDGYAYAFLLLAMTEVRVDWRFAALGALGIIINILGAVEFWTSRVPHL